jgi:hypothetical protein
MHNPIFDATYIFTLAETHAIFCRGFKSLWRPTLPVFVEAWSTAEVWIQSTGIFIPSPHLNSTPYTSTQSRSRPFATHRPSRYCIYDLKTYALLLTPYLQATVEVISESASLLTSASNSGIRKGKVCRALSRAEAI